MKSSISRFINFDYRIAILLCIALLSLFSVLKSAPLFDEDEGFYAEAGREMLANGDYLTAYMNGSAQYDKPILVYWAECLSFRFLGLNEFAARFPSAVATLLWMLAIYRFTRRHMGPSTGFLTALFFISAIQITITGKAAIVDPVLDLFLTLCMFDLYDYLQQRNYRIYTAALYAGLAFLAKGPLAIAIPLGVTLCYCLVQRQMRQWLRMVFNPWAILVFVLVALPWYLLEYQAQGMAFIQNFFLKNNLERYSHSFEGHSGSIFYYLPVIIIGTLPHCGLLIPLIRKFRNLLKDDLLRYCLIWTGVVLVLFSLAGTKLPHYILGAFPALFILYGYVYEKLEHFRTYLIPAALFLWILVVAPLGIPWILPMVRDRFAACMMASGEPLFGTGYYLTGVILAGIVTLLFFLRISSGSIKPAIVVSIVYLILMNTVLMPRVGELMQSPVKEAAQVAAGLPDKVVMWGHSLPSFMFYTRKFVQMRHPAPGDLLLTKESKLSEIGPYKMIYEKNCIVLVRVLGQNS